MLKLFQGVSGFLTLRWSSRARLVPPARIPSSVFAARSPQFGGSPRAADPMAAGGNRIPAGDIRLKRDGAMAKAKTSPAAVPPEGGVERARVADGVLEITFAS